MNSIELAIREIREHINAYNQIDEDVVSIIADKLSLSTIDFSNLCDKLSNEGILIVPLKEMKTDESTTMNKKPIDLIKSIYSKLSLSEKCRCISELALLIDDNSQDLNSEMDSSHDTVYNKNALSYTDAAVPENCQKYDFVLKTDMSFTKPVLLKFKGNVIRNNRWTEMFISFIKLLYDDNEYRKLLIKMVDSKSSILVDYNGSMKFRSARQIADNVYVETNKNSTEKVSVMKSIVDYCGISYNDVELYYIKEK